MGSIRQPCVVVGIGLDGVARRCGTDIACELGDGLLDGERTEGVSHFGRMFGDWRAWFEFGCRFAFGWHDAM